LRASDKREPQVGALLAKQRRAEAEMSKPKQKP
jgi:hypothetical protein